VSYTIKLKSQSREPYVASNIDSLDSVVLVLVGIEYLGFSPLLVPASSVQPFSICSRRPRTNCDPAESLSYHGPPHVINNFINYVPGIRVQNTTMYQ
jgi:hypothetical protein